MNTRSIIHDGLRDMLNVRIQLYRQHSLPTAIVLLPKPLIPASALYQCRDTGMTNDPGATSAYFKVSQTSILQYAGPIIGYRDFQRR